MKQCPIDFFDPEVKHLAASAGCRLYRMQNDTGEGPVSYTHLDVYKRQAQLILHLLHSIDDEHPPSFVQPTIPG